MTATVVYSISGDTLNGVVDRDTLYAEISADGVANPNFIGTAKTSSDELQVYFTTTPGGPQTAALDAVVGAHTGVPAPASEPTPTPTPDAVPVANGSGELSDGWVSQSSVTQHQGALSITKSQVTDLSAVETNVDGQIAGIASKGTPVAADLLLIEDSEDGNSKKRVTIDSLPGGGGSVDTGEEYFAESLGVSVTNSTSNAGILKVTLNFTPQVAGTFVIEWGYQWNHNATNTDFEGWLTEGGVQLGERHKQEPQDSGGSFGSTGSDQKFAHFRRRYRSLGTTPQTYAIRFRTTDSDDQSSIWEAFISARRIPT